MNNDEKPNNSRKEEILEKYRKLGTTHNDEGMENAVNKGFRLGSYFAGEIVGFPLFIMSVIAGQWLTVYALFSLYSAFCVGEFYAKFRFTNQKRYVAAVIIFAVTGTGTIIMFVLNAGTFPGWNN